MPNPDDVERDRRDVSIAMSESDHHYNDPDSDSKDEDTAMTDPNQTSDGVPGGEVKKKYDPKDPHRPRRKKARRACYACQRAHLTCGKIRSFPSHSHQFLFPLAALAIMSLLHPDVGVKSCPSPQISLLPLATGLFMSLEPVALIWSLRPHCVPGFFAIHRWALER